MPKEEKVLRLLRILMRSEDSILAALKKDMSTYGINWKEFMVLEFLYHKGQHFIQEIGERLSLPNSSLTYVLDKLEAKGYIRRQNDEADRRMLNVTITDQGEQLMRQAFPIHEKKIYDIFSVLTEEEIDMMSQGLKAAGLNAERVSQQIKD